MDVRSFLISFSKRKNYYLFRSQNVTAWFMPGNIIKIAVSHQYEWPEVDVSCKITFCFQYNCTFLSKRICYQADNNIVRHNRSIIVSFNTILDNLKNSILWDKHLKNEKHRNPEKHKKQRFDASLVYELVEEFLFSEKWVEKLFCGKKNWNF